MAQKTLVEVTDDITGETGASTVSFGLDGATYEIDLTDANAEALRSALSGYIASARRVKANGKDNGRGRSTGTSDRQRTAAIREWARQQGREVNERGRLPLELVKAFEAQGLAA